MTRDDVTEGCARAGGSVRNNMRFPWTYQGNRYRSSQTVAIPEWSQASSVP